MTRKEYEDAVAVNRAVAEAVLDIYFSTDDENKKSLMSEYILAIDKKRDEIELQWGKEIGLSRLTAIIRTSGLTYGKFSDKYGVSIEALIGVEAIDESTISRLEKAVCEDKAKTHLTWVVSDYDGNVENIYPAKSRKEALKKAEELWHHLTNYDKKRRQDFSVKLMNLDESDEHCGDTWITVRDFLEDDC